METWTISKYKESTSKNLELPQPLWHRDQYNSIL